MNHSKPDDQLAPVTPIRVYPPFVRVDDAPARRLPAPLPAPRRVHLGRALLLFSLPLVPAALLGWLVWPVHPFVGVAVAVGLYGAGVVALAVVMFASLQARQREREQ